MKIIQVISSLGKGGAERLVVDLCNKFSTEKDVEIVLCVYNEKNNEPTFKNELLKSVKYINLNKQNKSSLLFQIDVFRFLLKEKPDVVNSHLSGAVIYLYIPLLFLRKILFFHTVHNLAVEETTTPYLQKIRKVIYKTKKLTPISISKITKLSHSKLYNIDSELIYNGVNKTSSTGEFDSVVTEVNRLKDNTDTKVFLSIGRINAPRNQKNYALLLSVFEKLKLNNINAILLIIGADNSENTSTLNELLKIKPTNVYFLGTKNNISDYMLNANYYCLSSTFEGLPITIIEALEKGLPVLSTNVGGISEMITDNENGLLVNNFEIETYYQKVLELLSWNETKILNIKNNNIDKYNTMFSIEVAANNYLNTYNSKLKNK